MPWRGPEFKGDFPSLGHTVIDWIAENCAIPDGDRMGEPFELTEEQARFVILHYRIRPKARAVAGKVSAPFFYRRSQLVRPQKWGKGPLSAALICAEAEAPVLFDGWDANGDPVGRPWPTPWIQATAVSEDQTDNVWRSLLPMIELGALHADIDDTGLTRINLPGGGFIEPVTASARSRLGQRITFAVQDETHSWLKTNGGWQLADNQRRNLAGMGGRSIETTNGWDPNEKSVAQRTFEAKTRDVYRDFPQSPAGDFANKADRKKIVAFAYKGAPWVDLDRIEAEALELIEIGETSQAERFFGNRIVAGADRAFDVAHWAELQTDLKVAKKELITVGVDGARYEDALAVIATHVPSGHQWPIGIWERPENAGDDYEHPFADVDQALTTALDTWKLWRAYVDPQEIDSLVDTWTGRWGAEQIVIWRTDRHKQVAYALRGYRAAQTSGDLTHDGDPVYARHIANARRRASPAKDDEGHPMWTIGKDYRGSPRKIDAAMAGCLSWEARGDAIAAGVLKKKRRPRGHTF